MLGVADQDDGGAVFIDLNHLADDARVVGDAQLVAFDAEGGSADEPVRPDGYLRPDWSGGGWSASPARLVRWAELAAMVARQQQDLIAAMPDHPRLAATARIESAAELLVSEKINSVKSCGGCGWLFLDTTKSGRRRWCDMRICGNRAKSRRHYARGRV